MSSLVASAVLYGRAEPTTTTNSTSPGNETTTGCEHVNPDNLSEDQMFAAAAVIAVCCTLTAVTLAIFTWKKRWLFLQDTSIAICLGACIGAAVTYGSGGKYEQTVIMNSSFFFAVILPPIMFEAGYAINRPRFRKNFLYIMMTAFLGVVISTFISAIIMWACSSAYHGGGFESFMQSLVYASVLSATDPVSVLATFQAVPVHPDLDTLIFGESALNDAVGIIMYRLTSALIVPGAVLDGSTIGLAIGKVIGIFFGAWAIGILFGIIMALLLKWVPFRKRGSAHESGLVLGLAYCSYLLSNFFGLSGIISVMFCGIFCSEYVIPNLSHRGNENIETVLRTASLFMENLLFTFLGFGLGGTTNVDRTVDAAVIAYTFLGIVLGRAVQICILVPICNLTRRRSEDMFNWREMAFMIYAGLRGGIAFVLTLELRETEYLPEYYRQLCLGTTLVLIFISVVFIGGGTARTMKILKVEYEPPEEDRKEFEDTLAKGGDAHPEQRDDIITPREDTMEKRFNLDDWYSKIKLKFLAPILIRSPEFEEQQTLVAEPGQMSPEPPRLSTSADNDGLSPAPETPRKVPTLTIERDYNAPRTESPLPDDFDLADVAIVTPSKGLPPILPGASFGTAGVRPLPPQPAKRTSTYASSVRTTSTTYEGHRRRSSVLERSSVLYEEPEDVVLMPTEERRYKPETVADWKALQSGNPVPRRRSTAHSFKDAASKV